MYYVKYMNPDGWCRGVPVSDYSVCMYTEIRLIYVIHID